MGRDGEIIFLSKSEREFAHPVYQFRLSVASSPLRVLRMRSVCENENYEMKRKIPRGEVNGKDLQCEK